MKTTKTRQPVNTRPSFEAVKLRLAKKGWSNRTAAKELGCTPTHLSYVLNGHRQSRSLIERIEALPQRTTEEAAA